MSGGLLGFGTKIFTENFKNMGKYDSLRHLLYIITVSRTMTLLGIMVLQLSDRTPAIVSPQIFTSSFH